MHRHIQRILLALLSCTCLLLASGAYADPPSRVGRLSYIQGSVSLSPAGAGKHVWVNARINRPLVAGDRIWADEQARAELQLGHAAFRIEDDTSIRIINLNDHIAQLAISQGTLALHVRRLSAGEIYEVNTPQLAFKATQAGDYRIDVDDNGSSTTVTVYSGKGIVYAKHAAYKIKGPATYRFSGQNLQVHEHITLRSRDSFDRWSYERELRVTRSRSAKYVSTTIIGYEDLDTYGSWRYVKGYGNVWSPNQVPAGWAPYRNGHWSWVNPWGWTWIDDQPWGFAPSHYGRWAFYKNTWVWVPGRKTAQSSYAPALVAFVGGSNSKLYLSIGNTNPGIAWFPLGPGDVYVPPYKVSQQYFTNINVNNTTINQTHVTNVYNNQTVQTTYVNHQVPNAVTAVPTQVFVQSQPAASSAVPVSTTAITQAPVSTTAAVAPEQKSVAGAASDAAAKPSDATLDRVPVVVTPPPPSTVSLDEQKEKQAEKPDNLKPAETIPVETVTPPSDTAIPDIKPDEKTATPAVSDKVEPDKQVVDHSEADQAAAKAAADKEAAEKVQADQTAVKADADKQTVEKSEADHAAANAKADAEKEAAEKAQADQAAANAKADAEKEAAEKAQADQTAAAAKAEADKQAAEQAEAARASENAKAEAEKAAAEKAQADQAAAAAKAEADKQAAEQAEAARAAENAKAEAEKAAAEKAQADQAAAAAKAEADKQAAEQAEAARAAANAKAEAEKAQADQAAAAKADAEKQAAEQAEAERAAANANAEAEKAAAEKAQADQAATTQAETVIAAPEQAETPAADAPASEPTPSSE